MILGTLRAVLGAIYSRYRSTETPTIADAYLTDFLVVDAVDRLVAVDAEGRWILVPATGREFVA